MGGTTYVVVTAYFLYAISGAILILLKTRCQRWTWWLWNESRMVPRTILKQWKTTFLDEARSLSVGFGFAKRNLTDLQNLIGQCVDAGAIDVVVTRRSEYNAWRRGTKAMTVDRLKTQRIP
ncbi:hypothetical protein EDD85DRAFT_788184 [Armillaria nabsnona]|nr:hypothetical protein EDD85DRAFT_788184 [Armillaria nabsnona]